MAQQRLGHAVERVVESAVGSGILAPGDGQLQQQMQCLRLGRDGRVLHQFSQRAGVVAQILLDPTPDLRTDLSTHPAFMRPSLACANLACATLAPTTLTHPEEAGEFADERFAVAEQLVVPHEDAPSPGGVHERAGHVARPQRDALVEPDPVAPLQRARAVKRPAVADDVAYVASEQQSIPEGQRQGGARVLESPQQHPAEVRRKQLACPYAQVLQPRIKLPPLCQTRRLRPRPSQALQQILVDAHDRPVLEEPLGVLTRDRGQERLLRPQIHPQQREQARESGGPAARHPQHDDRRSRRRSRWGVYVTGHGRRCDPPSSTPPGGDYLVKSAMP